MFPGVFKYKESLWLFISITPNEIGSSKAPLLHRVQEGFPVLHDVRPRPLRTEQHASLLWLSCCVNSLLISWHLSQSHYRLLIFLQSCWVIVTFWILLLLTHLLGKLPQWVGEQSRGSFASLEKPRCPKQHWCHGFVAHEQCTQHHYKHILMCLTHVGLRFSLQLHSMKLTHPMHIMNPIFTFAQPIITDFP